MITRLKPLNLFLQRRLLTAFMSLCVAVGAIVSGCGSKEDRDIEAKLSTVATHRTEHPHYPTMIFGDFAADSQPAGVAVDAYGFYVHATSKPNTATTSMSQAAASAKLERTFERSLQAVLSAEASVPAPKPPYPVNTDWKASPHPKLGTYLVVSRFGPKPRTFCIAIEAKPHQDPAEAVAALKSVLLQDAALVVNDGVKAQNEGLQSLGTPCGFSLCTSELLKIQQGSRGVEPHLIGGPLLLVPIDKALALKGLDHSIRKLLASTAKIQPPPTTAHLVVDGPQFNQTYTISLSGPSEIESGIKAALEAIGSRIDVLNKQTD